MGKETETKLTPIILEILNIERKNLRSKAHTDVKMSEKIQKIIVDYADMRY